MQTRRRAVSRVVPVCADWSNCLCSASLYVLKVLRGSPPAETKEEQTADRAAALSDVCLTGHSFKKTSLVLACRRVSEVTSVLRLGSAGRRCFSDLLSLALDQIPGLSRYFTGSGSGSDLDFLGPPLLTVSLSDTDLLFLIISV